MIFFYGTVNTSGHYFASPNFSYPDTYENGLDIIIDVTQLIHDETQSQKILFWYDFNETGKINFDLGVIFNDFNSMYLYGYSYISRDFPTIDKKKIEPIFMKQSPPNLIIFSAKSDAFSSAKRSLNNLGYDATLISEKKVNRGNIQFNITIIKINQLLESAGSRSDTTQLSSSMLKELISTEYPEIEKENITDFEKVNIIRDWAYEHTDYPTRINASLDTTLDSMSEFKYYQKTAPDIYSAFLNDQGGVACSGTAFALHQLYEMYGFNSYYVALGDPTVENHTSHALTIVQINRGDTPILNVQDAYFDYTIVDKANNPLDFFEVVKFIRNDRYSDVVILYGTKKPLDQIIETSRIPTKSNITWTVIEENSTVQLKDNVVKIKIQKDLEKYDNFCRNYYNSSPIKSPYYNETYPSLSLFKNPYSFIKNTNPDNNLLKRMNCAADTNCSSEYIPDLMNNKTILVFNQIINNSTSINRFEFNCYAGKCYEIVSEESIILTPKSDSDHIASKFFNLNVTSLNNQEIITKLLYRANTGTMDNTEIYIQDNHFKKISDNLNEYVISNTTGGDISYYNKFVFPSENNSLRILIQGKAGQTYLLPKEIDLYQKIE